jgi:arylsulfatase A-like enzyme
MDEWELYDIQNDPEEMYNIYEEADESLIADLRFKLDSLQVMYGDTASLEEMRLMTDTVITRVYNEPMKVTK